MLRTLYRQADDTWHPLDMRLGGSQGRSERFGREKRPSAVTGFFKNISFIYKAQLPLEPWIVQPVVWLLCRQRYPCYRKRQPTLFTENFKKKLSKNRGLP
jgi:hypothetical protein